MQSVTLPQFASPAASVSQHIGLATVEVTYSRPAVKGRTVWGDLVPYGWNKQGFGPNNDAPWRAGANENTTIRFSHDVKVNGQAVPAGANQVEVLAATHTVAAAGFSVSAGKGCWVFTGDTGRNPTLWARLNQLDVSMLVIETAFSNRESQLAQRSLHLSPQVLATELENLDATKRFPIYITHTKPAETELIMAEIERFDRAQPGGRHVAHDIHWLRAGDVFVI